MSAPTFLDVASKVVIPLLTFGLGIAVSYLLRKREKRRDDNEEHIKQIARLCSQWHDQMVDLYAVATGNRTSKARFGSEVLKYVRRATIIPNLLLHCQALRRTGKYEALVKEVEELMKPLTTFRDSYVDISPGIRPEIAKQNLEAMLDSFDQHLQEVYRLAGASLSQ